MASNSLYLILTLLLYDAHDSYGLLLCYVREMWREL